MVAKKAGRLNKVLRATIEEEGPGDTNDDGFGDVIVGCFQCYGSGDGSSMKQIDAVGILDIAMSGTSATLLARRWESALLVNVDDQTLARLMSNAAAMKALMSIEGFRNLNQDIETIINKSEAVKKVRKGKNDAAGRRRGICLWTGGHHHK